MTTKHELAAATAKQHSNVHIPARVDRITSAYMAMEYEDAKEAGALGYMARAVVQATLPHTDPDSHYFERTNGLVTLSVMAKPSVGVPYGSMPRILLAWVCTEAVKTKSPELSLGRTQNEFLRKLELSCNGRSAASIKNQAHKLFSSLISLTANNSEHIAVENILIAKKATLFWSPKNPDQPSLWESTLTLSDDFFNEVTNAPIPIDMRAYHALRKSPLALDIYTWLTYRIFLLRARNRKEVVIPWEALTLQFGSSYGKSEDEAKKRRGIIDFRKKFLKRLKEVLVVYPEAKGNVFEVDNGLLVRKTTLHIKKKKNGYDPE